MSKKAVILLSGGPDSLTCLALARSEGYTCYALSFDYGQRHPAEIEAAKSGALAYEVCEHKILKLPLGEIGGTVLTDAKAEIPNYQETEAIPVTYVPARNTIFLAFALGWAEVIQADTIVIGVNAVDYSGYPDCRSEYIEAFQKLAQLATKAGVEGHQVNIYTPLIQLTKAEILTLGMSLGVDYSYTVSCYQADREGRACGSCSSCVIRAKGFIEAGLEDVTSYFNNSSNRREVYR